MLLLRAQVTETACRQVSFETEYSWIFKRSHQGGIQDSQLQCPSGRFPIAIEAEKDRFELKRSKGPEVGSPTLSSNSSYIN
jgi:hypothetical protein